MSTNPALTEELPVDPDTEQLVAYLDGELHGTERDAIEKRLLDEEPLRARLQELQTGWDWLDQLPSPATDEKLVETTLELLVTDLEAHSPAKKHSKSRSSAVLLAIALPIIAGVVGFGLVKYLQSRQVAQQLADLDIVENLDAYLYGDDSKLIHELMANDKWNSMVGRLEELRGTHITASRLVSSTPPKQRPAKLASLTVDQRATLESNWDRFERQPPESKAKLRKTADAVEAAADSDALLNAMVVYANWREVYLTNSELRDKVESSDPKTRRLGIKSAVDRTLQQVSKGSGRVLDDETTSRIFRVLQSILENRLVNHPEIAEKLESQPAGIRERLELRLMYRMLGISGGQNAQRGMRMPAGQPIDPITSDELIRIVDELDGAALEDYKLFSQWSPFFGPDPVFEEITLLSWAEETLLRRSASLDSAVETPITHYINLGQAERDRLDLLDPAEFKEEVLRSSKPKQLMGRGSRPTSDRSSLPR